MPIKFTCPSCGKGLRVADEMAGKHGRCPHCKNPISIPLSGELPETKEKIEPEEEEELRLVKEEIPPDVRRCPGCGILVDKSARTCPGCGTDLLTGQKFIKAKSLAREKAPPVGAHPAAFWAALPYALAYPFNPKGLALLVGGTIFFTLLRFGIRVPILGLLVAIFTVGYLATYMFSIIGTTANAEDLPPDWPSISHWIDDTLYPFGLLIAAILVSLGPFFVYKAVCVVKDIPTQNAIIWLLLIYAILYLPMALIAMAIFRSFAALNPVLIISSILKVPLQYLGALIFLGLLLVVQFLSSRAGLPQVPILSRLLSQFVSLYFLMVEMRILGLLYRYKEEKLNWF